MTPVQDGMPGGPRMSMPYWDAMAVICWRSGGSLGGGSVRDWAGSAQVRMKASKPAGSVTSKKRASSSELTVKVCGCPGAEHERSGWCSVHLAVDPDGQFALKDIEPFILAEVHMQR